MTQNRVALQAATSQLSALKLFADANGLVIAHSGVKVGSFTRDISTASGTQAVTGIGFQPVAVIFFSGVNTVANKTSFGLDDGTNVFKVADYNGVSAGAWAVGTNFSIEAIDDGTNIYQGKITSLDADGFTIVWTKTASPTGTLTIGYLALR